MNMKLHTLHRLAAPRLSRRTALSVAVVSTFAVLSAPTYAFRFGSEESGITGSFDSVISFGVTQRLASPSCQIVGNDNGGCNSGTNNPLMSFHQGLTGYANADVNYINGDDGNLNFNKGDIVSQVLKGTHELSLQMSGGWSALGRVTWSQDAKVSHTRRIDLADEAEDAAKSRIDLLDLWVAKSFELGGRPAKVKLGNQVISWGEDVFILGGTNQINAIDLGRYHTPGTQLKEIFIPAPMLSFSAGLTENLNVEAYYQFKWNSYRLDPVGTFFSAVDLVGKGKRPLYFPTSAVDDSFGAGFCAANLPGGRCGEPASSGVDDATLIGFGLAVPYLGEAKAKNSGQHGLSMRYYAPDVDSEFAVYYQRYHDKLPFLGFSGAWIGGLPTVTGYSWNYGEDKELFGASMNTKLGPVAVGAEISYRPRDSVQVDPTVPFGQLATGVFDRNSVYDVSTHKGFVEEKKWQAHVTGFYSFSRNDPLGGFAAALGATDGFVLGEVAVAHYPDLDRSGVTPYLLPNYHLPDKTSWGYVLEAALNYPNVFDTGITVTPQIDWAHDVRGTSPNGIPFVEGRKALTTSLLFNYRDQWKGALQWVQFSGGGDNNLMRDRDFLSASVSYSF
jgi:hypothetical protein